MADPNELRTDDGTIGGAGRAVAGIRSRIDGAEAAAVGTVPPPAATPATAPADAQAKKTVDQLIAEAQAKAAQKTPQQRMQELERKMRLGSDTDSDRKEYESLKTQLAPPAEQKPAEQAPADQTSFSDPNFRRTYRAPNGVLHDIYGPGAAQQGVAFHGGPGVPISGSSHPAFIGTAIPDTAGLVEYRIPRGNPLQDRILAQQNGGVA